MTEQTASTEQSIRSFWIAFPVALLVFSLVCDVIAVNSINSVAWSLIALGTMLAGFLFAFPATLLASCNLVVGPDGVFSRSEMAHIWVNQIVVGFYALNIALRLSTALTSNLTIWMSVAAVTLLCVSGLLGRIMLFQLRATDNEGLEWRAQ